MTSERRLLKKKIQGGVDVLARLYKFSRDIARAISPDQAAFTLIRSLPELVGCDRAVVALNVLDEWKIYYSGNRQFPVNVEIENFMELLRSADSSVTGHVETVEVSPGDSGITEASFLAHPLLVDGRFVGMVRIGSENDYAFDTETARMLALISHEAAGAVERLTLVERARRSAENAARTSEQLRGRMLRLGGLLQISDHLLSTLDTGQILSRAVEGLKSTVGASKAALLLFNNTRNEYRVEASLGMSEEECSTTRIKLGDGVEGRVALSGQLFVSRDISEIPVACIPVLSMGAAQAQASGLIVIYSTIKKRILENDEVEILAILANQLSGALANSRQLRAARLQAEERSTRLSSLHELARYIFEREKLLDRIIDAAVNLTESAEAILMLMRDGKLVTETVRGIDIPELHLRKSEVDEDSSDNVEHYDDDKPIESSEYSDSIEALQSLRPGEEIAGKVIMDGKAIITNSVDNDERFENLKKQSFFKKALIAVPLPGVNEDPLGVLMVHKKLTSTHFNHDDLEILQTLASQAAAAIHTSILHERVVQNQQMMQEMKLARDIQLGLLPEKAPSVNGLDIATIYRPARSVGGDYFDFFELDNGNVGIVIADVSGKGIPAALLMTMTKGALRSAVRQCEGPAAALSLLNDILCAELDPYKFVTMIFLEIDSKNGKLLYANAGHEFPVLLNGSDKKARPLEGSGFPLGFEAGAVWPEFEIEIENGDSIMLFTDGLTEAGRGTHGGPGMFGAERVLQHLEDIKPNSAKEMLDSLDRALIKFTGQSALKDDLTMVSIFHNGLE